MSKSRHAYLVPMVILGTFVIFLFTNCDRAKFPKQPSVYVPPVEVPQAAKVSEVPAPPDPVIPPTAESASSPGTADLPPLPQ